MTVHMPANVAPSIRQQVASGRFGDEAEVVREALRLLEARERRAQQLRDSVAEGLAAIERGEGIELTPDLMDEMEREAEALHRQGKQPKADVCVICGRRRERSVGAHGVRPVSPPRRDG